MKHYMIHVPGWIYAGDFYGRNKREAIDAYKTWAGVNRMPRGYAIWPYVDMPPWI